jgi:hypothetical protein
MTIELSVASLSEVVVIEQISGGALRVAMLLSEVPA